MAGERRVEVGRREDTWERREEVGRREDTCLTGKGTLVTDSNVPLRS